MALAAQLRKPTEVADHKDGDVHNGLGERRTNPPPMVQLRDGGRQHAKALRRTRSREIHHPAAWRQRTCP